MSSSIVTYLGDIRSSPRMPNGDWGLSAHAHEHSVVAGHDQRVLRYRKEVLLASNYFGQQNV